ncbi:MAG: DUF6345 domain-containing protein [Niabella sp.]
MNYKKLNPESPVAKVVAQKKGSRAVISGSADWYGACSIEKFNSSSALSLTHEDAQGFLDYPTQFAGKAANFWMSDGGVKVWAYEEAYDNWQDTYGMDAVTVFYHSGHGAMNSNGVFWMPLGGVWDNRDKAYSNKMAFANETLRYLFLSTCYSLRVSGNDSPVRTWWDPNKGGLRMLFGYETTSVDNGNYGKYFWDEWKKGKTFTRAFLDASWRISHNQVAVAMACGANQTEAVNRLNTERLFNRGAVGKGWYQWQWIGTLPNRSFNYKKATPKQVNALILANHEFADARIAKIANTFGIAKTKASTILLDQYGNRMVKDGNVAVNVNSEGAVNIALKEANAHNTSLINERKAISIAKATVKELQFDKGVQLVQGNIRHRFTNGGSLEGSGTLGQAAAIETIVQYRQVHKGVKSINSDHGLITVGIDNDGNVTNVYNATKQILGEKKNAAVMVGSPKEKAQKSLSNENAINDKIQKIISDANYGTSKKRAFVNINTIREDIGYDFSATLAPVVQQKDVDIDFGDDIQKRYKVRVPFMG